jgi:hypothetical protein
MGGRICATHRPEHAERTPSDAKFRYNRWVHLTYGLHLDEPRVGELQRPDSRAAKLDGDSVRGSTSTSKLRPFVQSEIVTPITDHSEEDPPHPQELCTVGLSGSQGFGPGPRLMGRHGGLLSLSEMRRRRKASRRVQRSRVRARPIRGSNLSSAVRASRFQSSNTERWVGQAPQAGVRHSVPGRDVLGSGRVFEGRRSR